jgi:hypothetical protein
VCKDTALNCSLRIKFQKMVPISLFICFFSDREILFRILCSYWNCFPFYFQKYTIEFVITKITVVPCC